MTDPKEMFDDGVRYYVAGRLAEAEQAFRDNLRKFPEHADSLHLLGVTIAQRGRLDEAKELIEKAISQQPNHPMYRNNLAEVFRLQNRWDEAFEQTQEAVALAPTFPDAHYTQGLLFNETRRDEEAVAAFRRALELNPKHGKARFAIANILRAQGRVPMARTEYARLVEEFPQWFEARLNYAVALLELGECEKSIEEHLTALSLRPEHAQTADNLMSIHARLGRVKEAKEWHRRANEKRPREWLRDLRAELVGEVIPTSNQAIDDYREHVTRTLDQLHQEPVSLDSSLLHLSGIEPPMILLYQGREDRSLREKFADVYSKWITPLEPLPASGKPSVGVVVTKGHEGVFGRCLGDMLNEIDNDKIDITIVCSFSGRNILRHLYPYWSMSYLVLSERIDEAAEIIRERRFHRLLFWEVGTDSMNYFLPFYRPCVTQAATWGWPVTTGNRQVNEFVSADCLEVADADKHYVERLVRLKGIPTYYKFPSGPNPLRSRQGMGIDEEDHIYFCSQNVRKVHPDFDVLVGEILRRDSKGKVLIIGDEQQAISDQLVQRFQRTLPDVVDRLFVLSRMPTEMYLNALALADVNLDTLYYGGGANTVFDTLAVGTPMVTLPGEYHRSRFAAGIFEISGVTSTIARSREEYVEIALRIASDAELRKDIHTRLISASREVLENRRAVHAWEEYLLSGIE